MLEEKDVYKLAVEKLRQAGAITGSHSFIKEMAQALEEHNITNFEEKGDTIHLIFSEARHILDKGIVDECRLPENVILESVHRKVAGQLGQHPDKVKMYYKLPITKDTYQLYYIVEAFGWEIAVRRRILFLKIEEEHFYLNNKLA